MRFSPLGLIATLALSLLPACGGGETSSTTDTTTTSGSTGETGGGGAGGATSSGSGAATGSGGESTTTPIDKAADCASTFGDALTDAFGRLDGTVLAVVKPSDVDCPLPNNDHVILQVLMDGAAYRMVINIESSFGDPQVRYLVKEHALPEPAWAEGWHTGIYLDYKDDLDAHTGEFTPYPLAELADRVADEITLGEEVSVYATSSGGNSAHKIHRNAGITDGAIVLDPNGPAPRVMLFHFSDQTF